MNTETGENPIGENAKILVVDDNLTNLHVLLDHLKEAGFRVLISRSGEKALAQADEALPDLILLDVMMPPGMDGFETCRQLKQNEKLKEIPVIFLTALSEGSDKAKGIEAGGVDYVTKPFDGTELLARVRTHLKIAYYRKALEQKNRELQQAHEALLTSRKKIEQVARTDPLTGLPNRREIMNSMGYETVRFERSRKPFSIAIADIDNFKQFNDRYGHDCGDFILVSVSALMRTAIRKQDHLARWGGEEFLFIFPETDLEGGTTVCEKIRETIAGHVFTYKDKELSVTMTSGICLMDNDRIPFEDYIRNADRALYQGKQQGRNRVNIFTP